MEFNLKIIILFSSILLTGITTGLCYTWQNAITPGIGRLDHFGFLRSFQAMNRAIINPGFLLVFFGPVLLLLLNAYLHQNANPLVFRLFLLAAISFFVGVALVTVFKNVPLNEILDKSILENMSATELKDLRNAFEKPWNRWHLVRTLASLIAFISLLTGLIYSK